MSSSEVAKSLEEKLEEAGEKLREPPSSLDKLLPLLDKIENSLSKVEQSPAKSTHTALAPLMKALVADELLKHSDIDVKVAVASCISEITRITAPDAPYGDEKMKEVFQLIVSAFENLADKSSISYRKRALILETVAKVRSCVIMLDLECNELIAEMFKNFLRTIRDYHPENIFSSMETIMSLVLDESEDVPTELLAILLCSMRIDNEEVSPIARRLGESVFEKCALKLKPYLIQAIKTLGVSLDDYSKIVTSVCEGTIGQNNDNVSKDQKEAKDVVEEASQEVGDPAPNGSPKPTLSNGISETRKEGTPGRMESHEKGEHLDIDKITKDEVTPKPESDDSGAENSIASESKRNETVKKKGRTRNSSTKSEKSSDPSRVDDEKVSAKLLDNRESHKKDADSSATEDACPEDAKELEKEEDMSTGEGGESAEDTQLPELVTRKASQRTSDSKAKPQQRSGKKTPRETTKSKTRGEVGTSKNEDGTTSDSEAKPLKQMAGKLEASDSDEDGSSIKKKDMKKRGRGKASMEKHTMKTSTKNDVKEVVSSSKSPTESSKEEDHLDETRNKRKCTPGKEKATGTEKYGESLVGSKVKVWWPQDRMFYDGVIDSFDPIKKKHKVSYIDGDEEILNLRKERWEFIGEDAATDVEDEAEPANTKASEMHRRKKTKKGADSSVKHQVDEVSPKRKLKGTAIKSGKRSRDDGKPDPKSRDDTSDEDDDDDEIVIKSKAHSRKPSGKSVSNSPKPSGKSKNLDSDTRKSKSKQVTTKTASKSKEDNAKTAVKGKGKTPQSGNKSSSNGGGKVKSNSSKVKISEEANEETDDSTETPQASKRKRSDSSKDQGTETKSSSKKRHRSVKG